MDNVGRLFTASKHSIHKDEKNLTHNANALRKDIHMGSSSRSPSPVHEYPREPPLEPEEYRKLWQDNEARWGIFTESNQRVITYDSIPFPPCDHDVLEFIQVKKTPGASRAAAFKRACLRYHPDKFMQQYGALLHKDDYARVIARLNSITQAINSEWQKKNSRKPA